MQIKFTLIFRIEKHDEGSGKYVKMGKEVRVHHYWVSRPTYAVAKSIYFPFLLQYVLLIYLCFGS